jgi:ribosome modulation factor
VSEVITYRQFDNALKRIERDNMKRFRMSSSFASMSNRCHDIIQEIRSDEETLVVVNGWRQKLKDRFVAVSD